MKKYLKLTCLFVLYLICSCSDKNEDFYISIYEDGEEFLTGDLSVYSTSNNAFGKEIPGLNFQESATFATGNSLFNQAWVSAPASTTARDGLGPTFNARSCSACHFKDGRGKPHTNGQNSEGFLVRVSINGQDAHGGPLGHPIYGGQIQDQANLNIPHEAKVIMTQDVINGMYPDGTSYQLLKPSYSFTDEQFGTIGNFNFSPRVGQQVIGLGLIDALDEASILTNVDVNDVDEDEISGKANYVWDAINQTLNIGKFGWKANQPNLRQQVAGALNGDLGLTTSIFSEQNCPSPQNDCQNSANGGTPEVTDSQLDQITFYQSALAVPTRRNYMDNDVLQGKLLFKQVDCKKCHATNFTTSNNYPTNSYLENITIHPYSDFLLHDMGDNLADNREDFLANGNEWRTQPLWGIGLIETVNNHTNLLHDGRARNIEEAILWHGGEAETSKQKFMNLTTKERQQLIAFINSL